MEVGDFGDFPDGLIEGDVLVIGDEGDRVPARSAGEAFVDLLFL